MYPVQWLYQGNVLVNVVADRVLRGSPREGPSSFVPFQLRFPDREQRLAKSLPSGDTVPATQSLRRGFRATPSSTAIKTIPRAKPCSLKMSLTVFGIDDSRCNDAFADGVKDDLGSIVDPQFLHQVRAMRLHGVRAQV